MPETEGGDVTGLCVIDAHGPLEAIPPGVSIAIDVGVEAEPDSLRYLGAALLDDSEGDEASAPELRAAG